MNNHHPSTSPLLCSEAQVIRKNPAWERIENVALFLISYFFSFGLKKCILILWLAARSLSPQGCCCVIFTARNCFSICIRATPPPQQRSAFRDTNITICADICSNPGRVSCAFHLTYIWHYCCLFPRLRRVGEYRGGFVKGSPCLCWQARCGGMEACPASRLFCTYVGC